MNNISHKITAIDLITQTTELMEKVISINVQLNTHDILCVIGPRAGGKTTLIKTLVGLTPPAMGEVAFFDQPIHKIRATDWQTLRRKLVYISSDSSLLSDKNGLHNLILPALYHNIDSRKNIKTNAKKLIQHIDPSLALTKLVPYLSLEQRCKLVICRGLLLNPEVMCLDEAFKGLHHLSIDDLEEFLVQQVKASNMALIVGTHNMSFVKKYATKIIYISRTTLSSFDSFEALENSELESVKGFLSRSRD